MKPRLKERFEGEVAQKVGQEFGIKNPMAMPRLEKIVLNVGLGKQLEGTKLNPKAKEQTLADLAVISGQKPVVLKARKSVANFKVREGYEIGAMVTLRGDRMWEFFDRLITLAIPRIKDFRGLKDKSFDGRGSYTFGVAEQGIFPEVNMADAQFTHGMHITLAFKNSTDQITKRVMEELGFPFIKPEDQPQPRRKSA
jgi:large subunit ribosomal protein L5